MRLITYNIRGGLGMDGVRSTRRIAEVLQQAEADIICLQEVHKRLPWSRFRDQPRQFSRLLGKQVIFQANYGYGLGGFGNAIITAFPVALKASFRIPNGRERESILRMPEKRGLFRADLQTDGGLLTVFTTHWSLHEADRMESAHAVASRVCDRSGPLALCGDFNTQPGSPEMNALLQATGLSDAAGDRPEPTFTSDNPKQRIDYVLTSKQIRVTGVQVVQAPASDHLPVVVDFELI